MSLFFHDEQPDRKMIPPPDGQDENSGLEISLPTAFAGKITPFAQPAIEHILRWQELNDLYTCVNQPDDADQIWERILHSLNVIYQVSPEDVANIPKKGPLVVVANHPYGGIEGVILAALLRSIRSDVKVMANQVLCSFPGLRDSLIPVDPFGNQASARYNIRGLKAAIGWVREGGVLAVFPAGEVAHVDMNQLAITDPAWHEAVAAIIRRASAAAVPVFFAGNNGPWFQLLGMVHPLLRTVMLPSELLNKRNQVFKVRIGHPLPHRRLSAFPNDAEMTAYLRWRTYLLGHRQDSGKAPGRWTGFTKTTHRAPAAVFAPPEDETMERRNPGSFSRSNPSGKRRRFRNPGPGAAGSTGDEGNRPSTGNCLPLGRRGQRQGKSIWTPSIRTMTTSSFGEEVSARFWGLTAWD